MSYLKYLPTRNNNVMNQSFKNQRKILKSLMRNNVPISLTNISD